MTANEILKEYALPVYERVVSKLEGNQAVTDEVKFSEKYLNKFFDDSERMKLVEKYEKNGIYIVAALATMCMRIVLKNRNLNCICSNTYKELFPCAHCIQQCEKELAVPYGYDDDGNKYSIDEDDNIHVDLYHGNKDKFSIDIKPIEQLDINPKEQHDILKNIMKENANAKKGTSHEYFNEVDHYLTHIIYKWYCDISSVNFNQHPQFNAVLNYDKQPCSKGDIRTVIEQYVSKYKREKTMEVIKKIYKKKDYEKKD